MAPADWLKAAIETLRAAGVSVIAPKEEEPGLVNLAPVASVDEIAVGYGNALLPLKRLFCPETEVLLAHEKRENGDVDVQAASLPADGEIVVIGCRPCDAAALDVLDTVFQWDYDDVPYRARRERTTIVSFACTKPAPECFCTSVGGSPGNPAGSDALVFCLNDEETLLQALTPRGERLIERLGDLVHDAPVETALPDGPDVKQRFDPEKVKHWLDDHFESDFWLDASLRCLGCGVCSYLCPTCHCFDIVDEATWNRGERRRNWDCCSFGLFTLHGSGHNPRPDQAARYRQRVMHKFKYFPERFGRIACVGCGRCIRACGVGQNLLGVLAAIEEK